MFVEIEKAEKEETMRCETPLTIKFLMSRTEKYFPLCQVNTDDYFREVRKALYTNMFGEERITLAQYNSFCQRYIREGGTFNKHNSQPKFDAWCLIRGTSRLAFNHGKFFTRYPTCRDQIRMLRNQLDIKVKDNLN